MNLSWMIISGSFSPQDEECTGTVRSMEDLKSFFSPATFESAQSVEGCEGEGRRVRRGTRGTSHLRVLSWKLLSNFTCSSTREVMMVGTGSLGSNYPDHSDINTNIHVPTSSRPFVSSSEFSSPYTIKDGQGPLVLSSPEK